MAKARFAVGSRLWDESLGRALARCFWISAAAISLLGGCDSDSQATGGAGGGTGGSTGGAGGGGGGAGGMTTTDSGTTGPCDTSLCPPPSNECKQATCVVAGQCAEEPANDGMAIRAQTPGDCKKSVCSNGFIEDIADDTDVKDDSNECTFESCIGGEPASDPAVAGATCASNGGKVCDGNGACVACVVDQDCTDPQNPQCLNNECTFFVPKMNGEACAVSVECQSAFCVDGVCCDSACIGVCEACSNAKTGQPDGVCEPVPSGSDPDNECDGNLDCDGMGVCEQ